MGTYHRRSCQGAGNLVDGVNNYELAEVRQKFKAFKGNIKVKRCERTFNDGGLNVPTKWSSTDSCNIFVD